MVVIKSTITVMILFYTCIFQTLRKANEMMRTITRLEKAIAEKEGFMTLAQTRLEHRAQRPATERTR
jgi:hypothetical protein